MRKAFGSKVAKSYHKLTLIPPSAAHLRDADGAPKVVAASLRAQPTRNVMVTATSAEVSEFLRRHGGEAKLWKSEKDGMTVVQRRTDNSD
ncbi:MAG: hypothetical protein JWN86_4061 [Planctomycetota bacterium]|nr:hypothetical protein [Planctomycetota bacterium]